MHLQIKLLLILSLFSFSAFAAQLPVASSLSNPVSTPYGFIQNKGQIIDQNNQPNKEVLYLYCGKGLNVQLRKNGFSYEVMKKTANVFNKEWMKGKELNTAHRIPDSINNLISVHRIDIEFEGAQKNSNITTDQASKDVINYYTTATSEAGITNVHHYKKIIYKNIYPLIDVEFVINEDQFKYNFIIRPGGDINTIKLKFDGAAKTSLTKEGSIDIETAYGTISESIPLSYQLGDNGKQKEIKAKFKQWSLNKFGIGAEAFNSTQTLIVDPTPWATYFGGDKKDRAYAIASDASGNVYVTGETGSASVIATSGAFQTSFAGNSDAFIAKLSPAGVLLWATYYGGSLYESANGICIDANSNVLVTGWANSDSLATLGAYQYNTPGGGAFILKLNTLGIRQWSTYYWSTDGAKIATDAAGNIFVTGYTNTDSVASAGAYQTTLNGINNDAFIVKFTSAGVRLWATYYGGSGDDKGTSLATDATGNVLITGFTQSAMGIATAGAYQTTLGGDADVFILKLNTNGIRQWCTYYGGDTGDVAIAINVDVGGNILVTGYTQSNSGIATTGAFQTDFGGGEWDAFILKFNSSGFPLWATYYGDMSDEFSSAIITDAGGNIFVGGETASITNMVTSGAYQTTFGGGGTDGFLVKLNAAGTRQWGSYFGGNGDDWVRGITKGLTGNILFAGYTSSTSGIATTGAHQTIFGGIADGFIASVNIPVIITPITNNSILSNQYMCIGSLPAPLSGSIPLGGNESFIYNWLSSITGSTSGFALAAGSNQAINYVPGSVGITTWYKRVVNSAGYTDTSNVISVTIGVKLKAGFTINKQIQCIKNNHFIFTDTTRGSLSRLWTFGNGDTSSIKNPGISYNYNVANSPWVKLVSSINGACADSVMQRVFLINNPTTTFITGDSLVNRLKTVTYSVPATIGSSYQWLFTNGIGTGSTNSINIKWNISGIVNLKVIETSGGGCKGDTVFKAITINGAAGLNYFDPTTGISVYPNPTNGLINIINNAGTLLRLSIADMQGRIIYTASDLIHQNGSIIDLSAFENGMYTLNIITETGNRVTYKIMLIK